MEKNLIRLVLPEKLNEQNVFPLLQEMRKNFNAKKVVFDYSKIEFAPPFGALILSDELKYFREHRCRNGLVTDFTGFDYTNRSHTYLAHIGFFQHHGESIGSNPGDFSGNSHYLPFHNIEKKNLNIGNSPVGMAVEKEAEKLTRLILNIEHVKINHPVEYCFREVIRNVFEHGKTESCMVSAPKWESGYLEIAVIDRGCGIRESLSDIYELDDDYDALLHAISPGISRVKDDGNSEDVWKNSGYGLYVLSELAKYTGKFILCSGSFGLFININCSSPKKVNYPFSGTAIRLYLKKPKGKNVNDIIRHIIENGKKINLMVL